MALEINDIICFDDIIDKIKIKHDVTIDEVEEVFYNKPLFRRGRKGNFKNENLYYVYGQSDNGRYLLIVFIYKKNRDALIITARDMDYKERKIYGKRKSKNTR
jgi:uncharacterized protein